VDLEILLEAFNRQEFRDFELILAEDDCNPETQTFLSRNKDRWSYPIVHVFQEEKKGFRKKRILNRAAVAASGRFLVFLDGDCIPHRSFLKQYPRYSETNTFYSGRRVLLGKNFSEKMRKNAPGKAPSMAALIFSDSTRIKEGLYLPFLRLHRKQCHLSGCNWGIRREELFGVNGFDEDYERPGTGEDLDIEWRMLKARLTIRSVKNKAIVYHLYHDRSDRKEDGEHGRKLMEKKMELGQIRCLNGIEKLKVEAGHPVGEFTKLTNAARKA
jgi:cellulose synthase/poly-beta-1,6-N-acetylglucosamine synthase-like glycosyltransferase